MVSILDKPRKRRRFIAYDLEWHPDTCKLRLIGVKDLERGYRFYQSVDAFLDAEIIPENSNAWFAAHAGGLADILFLLGKFIERGFKCEGISSGSSLIIFTVTKGQRRYTFIDSYWILRDKLAKIGESIGVKKGDCAFTAPLAELIPYNETDCHILLTGLYAFEREIWELGGELQMTVASTAMNLFRRVYLKRSWNVPHVINDALRTGYHGGRVEVIRRGIQENGNIYDINSSFPFAMTKPLPGEFVRQSLKVTDCCWVDATVKASGYLPGLPFKADALYFPVGEWRGWFYIGELDQPDIDLIKVHRVFHFNPSTDLGGYVNEIYSRRKASKDEFRRLVYKYLLNCLYGKFGERAEKEQLIFNPDGEWLNTRKREARAAKANGDEWNKVELLMPGVWISRDIREVPHEHVGLAGAITGLARRNIRGYMKPVESDVHYVDTDGFSTHATFDDNLELGGLKLLKAYKTADFVAPKVYRYDDEIKVKGFPLRAIAEDMGENLSPELRLDLFDKIKEGEQMHFRRMVRAGEQVSKGQIPVAKLLHTHKRFRDSARPKRYTYEDGSTRPWEVSELTKAQ